MSATRDYAVVLLPDPKTTHQAKELTDQCLAKLKYLDNTKTSVSIPHISLYQFSMRDNDADTLMEELKLVCHNYAGISFKMSNIRDTKENIFWCSTEAKVHLKSLHALAIDIANQYRDTSTPFSQIAATDEACRFKNAKAISQFGIFWGLVDNFDPHITLVYNSGEHDKLQQVLDTIALPEVTCMVDAIAVVRLGPAGEVFELNNEHIIKLTPPSSSQTLTP